MFALLKHLFLPHEKNNHRAKLLHNSSLLLAIFFLLTATLIGHAVKTAHPEVLGVSYSISESDLISFVNQERVARGLAPLKENSELDDAARRKAADMFQKNYWAHFAPDGSTSPWGFIRAAGYNYQFAGENLAKGFTDAKSVVDAWMNSPTHRDNLLSDKYIDEGFAIVPGTLQGEDTVLVVEMFGSVPGENVAAVPATSASDNSQNPVPTETLPSIAPTAVPEKIIVKTAEKPVESASTVSIKPKVNAGVTKNITGVGLTFLAFGFLFDFVIVERKKIPRIVGHNLDHIMLLAVFILFMIIMSGGVIL
jgi:hypothetical protein